MKKLNQKAFSHIELIIVAVVIALVAGIGYSVWQRSSNSNPDSQAESLKSVTDFSKIYPNSELHNTKYLNGNNYVGGSSSWAVLWFGNIGTNGSYKMYNSDPASSKSKCHWDQFQWNRTDLRYSRTRNTCSADTDIQYSPGISYLPRQWNGSNYKKSGNSVATYYESGRIKCLGTNQWVSEIFQKPVELSPGVKATHVRNSQTTTWTAGVGSSITGCRPGEKSRYQENLYFITDLPIYGTNKVAPGLKRSVGGSLDFYDRSGWDWDIWFDNWMSMPKG